MIALLGLTWLLALSSAAAERQVVKRQVGSTPTCGQPLYTGVVSESSPPGTFILNAAATSNVGSSVTWSLQDTTLQKFVISPAGAVSVAGSLQRAALQRSAMEFRIRATDNSNQLYCESTVRINILPNAATTQSPIPQQAYFSQNSYTFSVGSAQSGTYIGQVSVVNPSGGFVTSSPAERPSRTPYWGPASSRSIPHPVPSLPTATSTPEPTTFNVVGLFFLRGTSTAQVTITANCFSSGTAPSFSKTFYTVTSQSCTAGSSIALVQAAGSLPPQYSLQGTSQFSIDPNSGQLSLNQNVAGGTYTFQIFATSAAGQATATVTVIVSCPITQPSQSYYIYSGSCPAGTQIGSICSGGQSTGGQLQPLIRRPSGK
ncbi:hypothetical protein BV898_13281 [Hypsibius exemplaris]|uniref:Cadherin domain-containing protein n=1 Tax=Hypsibius exemplaris TaxID=2072580 RepID=A0A1W0WBC7_HYPEX|nr:hypothetical protein BV898_13281 [Hypsibius exemplaris]